MDGEEEEQEEEEQNLVVMGCRCVEKTAEASKSAAPVDKKVAGTYLGLGGGYSGREAARNARSVGQSICHNKAVVAACVVVLRALCGLWVFLL